MTLRDWRKLATTRSAAMTSPAQTGSTRCSSRHCWADAVGFPGAHPSASYGDGGTPASR
jgi:hypothetical protein